MLKSTEFQGTVDLSVEGGTVLVEQEEEDTVAMEMEYTRQLQETMETTMAEVHQPPIPPGGSMRRRQARELSPGGLNPSRIDNNHRQRPSDRDKPARIDNQRTNFKDFKEVNFEIDVSNNRPASTRDVNIDDPRRVDNNPSKINLNEKPVAVLKPSVYRSTLTHAPFPEPVVSNLEEPIKIKPPQARGKKTDIANKEAIISLPSYTRKDVDMSKGQAGPPQHIGSVSQENRP